ncbi:MAG: AIM24 family protein [Clostridia bacterium]|nr:AIM24 family protein [Clostridia bacterium]
MFSIRNLTDNDNILITEQKGPFQVLEYLTDLSVSPENATREYFASAMNVRRRQVLCDLSQTRGVRTQAGAMQWMLGDVSMTSGIQGVGGLIGNALRGKASGESAVKPEYTGKGLLALEPTYKYILLEDLNTWNGSIVVEDGMFLACEMQVGMELIARRSVSSAVAGKEGLFNLCMTGSGVVCLESRYPRGELVEISLDNDTIRIDGNMAVCWSKTLSFTVERSAKSLVSSALSGEGLVNVYRGTGKILMAPVA